MTLVRPFSLEKPTAEIQSTPSGARRGSHAVVRRCILHPRKRRDYYQVLGIPSDAGEREIRSAYRGLAKRYHPDTGDGSSEEKFRDVQDAYDVLGDPEKRRRYDEHRRPPQSVGSASMGSAAYGAPYGRRPERIDLRYVNRRSAPEPLEFTRRDPFAQSWPDDDLWELLRFLLIR
jgi:curved DNA-binding protein CbpA